VVGEWSSFCAYLRSSFRAFFLAYDVFYAFDGGRSWAHHPYALEIYNHPLHLRALRGPNDMHIAGR